MSTLCCPQASQAVYKPRRAEKSVLHRVVKKHYASWLEQREETPAFYIQQEFCDYLQCGILAHGFAYCFCDGCNKEYLVGFSCKGRGICPSCNTKSMVATAMHLESSLIPAVPMRQWVISFPKRLRYYIVDPAKMQSVLRIVVDEVRRCVVRCSYASPEAQFGAISFIQNFGSTLNLHPHIHLIVTNGVFDNDAEDGFCFCEAIISKEDVDKTQEAIRHRVLKLFQRKRIFTKEEVEVMLGYTQSGFSLNADVVIQGRDREGLERLIRYCARPPFAAENLRLCSGMVVYRFPKQTHTGMRQCQLTPEVPGVRPNTR